MKIKLLCISLLFTWIFQIGFPYLKYELRRRDCWEQFVNNKNDFSPREIQQFNFNEIENRLSWEKENKEFRLDSNFYDVISIEESAAAKIISCAADKDEDALLRAYEQFLKHRQKQKPTFKFKKLAYFFELTPDIEFGVFHQKERAVSFEKYFKNISSKVSSPPPKAIS